MGNIAKERESMEQADHPSYTLDARRARKETAAPGPPTLLHPAGNANLPIGLLAVCKPNPPPKMALAVPCKTVGQAFSLVSREEWLQRGFFLTAGEPPLSSNALMALTSAAPLARNSLMRSRATCSSSFSPRGNSVTRTCLRSSRLRLRRT